MKLSYVYLMITLIVLGLALMVSYYTTRYYIVLLYVIYVVLLVVSSYMLIITKKKSEVLLIATTTLLIVRTLPRFSNLFSGYALAPGDEGYDLSVVLITLNNGHLVYEQINGHNVEYVQYPMPHIFMAILHMITNIESLYIFVILPQILSLTILLFFYETFKSISLDKTKLSVIIYLAFLLAGVHAQYWSTFVRESYASVFSMALLLNVLRALTASNIYKLPILTLFILALVLSHYATNIYTILSMLLLILLSLILKRYIDVLRSTSKTRTGGGVEKLKLVIYLLTLTNLMYILYNEFLFNYTHNWLRTLVKELQYYPLNVLETIPNIGLALYVFERIFIYIHYITLLLLLFLLYRINSKSLPFKLKLILFLLAIIYFLLIYARFIPGQGGYPLKRFAHHILFIYISITLLFLNKQDGNIILQREKSIISVTLLLMLLAMGYLAQVSPLFKYHDYRLSINPMIVMNFVATSTACNFNFGFIAFKPYTAIDRYTFSLLDSYNIKCSNISYFQFILTESRVYGNVNEGVVNIVVLSPKRGEPLLQTYSIIYSAHDVILQTVNPP
mgnify:CR=1 FL=1